MILFCSIPVHTPPSTSLTDADSSDWQAKAYAVREEARSSWQAYALHSPGLDTLKPRSRSGDNNFGGMAISAIDGLDTLYLMGLTSEYQSARSLALGVNFSQVGNVNLFETTIRALGGLLSSHALSRDPALLAKAKELGDRLVPAFKTPCGRPSGCLPSSDINLKTGRTSALLGQMSLAEVSSLSLEFQTLALATRQPKFQQLVGNVRRTLMATVEKEGRALLPLFLNSRGEPSQGVITLGARGECAIRKRACHALQCPQLSPKPHSRVMCVTN
jgi:hypothetical protein